MKHIITLSIICTVLFNCKNSETKEVSEEMHEPKTTISDQSKKIKDYMKTDIVIAHRGSTYWTPEETEPAFLWARNIGADYLEFDVQLTKDNHLIAFHDNDLSRTTNVSEFLEFPRPDKHCDFLTWSICFMLFNRLRHCRRPLLACSAQAINLSSKGLRTLMDEWAVWHGLPGG